MTKTIKIRVLPAPILTFMLGASLLVLSIPKTINAFLMISANSVVHKIQINESVSEDEVSLIIDSKSQALLWDASGRNWTDLALAQLVLAGKTENDDEVTQDLLAQARISLKTGLALAPGNTFAWTRLAYVEYLVSGPSADVASALQMAIWTAPYTPSILFSRLELCFIVWPHFLPTHWDAVMQQVRLAWKEDQDRVVSLAQDFHRIDVVRAALSTLPGEEARLLGILRQPPS